MKRDNWLSGKHGVRPAGTPDRCFYCNAPVGTQHRTGCVIRQRTVVLRTVIEHVVTVPEHWDDDLIGFTYTESSRCCSNTINDLTAMLERMEKRGVCACPLIESSYVREATEDDETACATFIVDEPS